MRQAWNESRDYQEAVTRKPGRRLTGGRYYSMISLAYQTGELKGFAAVETARAWGMPEQILSDVMMAAGIEEPRRAGRPVGSGDGRTITKRLRLTPEEDADLQRRVEESGDSWSQYVRRQLFK